MKNKKYYGTVSYRKKNSQSTAIGILVFVLLLLIALIIWAIFNFASGTEGVFTNHTTQISELKIENESLKLEIEELKGENKELKAEVEEYKILLSSQDDENETDDENPDDDETNPAEIQ